MDLERLRAELPTHLCAEFDLDVAWRRYRASGGADDRDDFIDWLLLHHPRPPLAEDPSDSGVQLSQHLPSRLAAALDPTAFAAPAAAPTLPAPAAADATAVASERRRHFHYVLLGEAGSGGMGTVHIARDTELMRKVALKTLNTEAAVTPGGQARFLREAQITAQLSHPNIVGVYALEVTPEGRPAYTMKLVEGRTFHALLHETRAFYEAGKKPDEAHSLSTRLEHFLKVCDAMSYAHDKDVIHRDLKPANLMLGKHNEVYVMDWGLCRLVHQDVEPLPADASRVGYSPEVSGSASETQVGDVVGTPKYMSPEQAQGRNRELDAKSDQCALGLILFEMVTLTSPYAGKNAYEVMVSAAMARRRPIVAAYKGMRIARELRAVIDRATAALPSERYDSVAAFAADLRRYLRGEAVLAQPDNPWQAAQRWISRHRQTAVTVALAGFAIGSSIIGWLIWQNDRSLTQAMAHEQHVIALQNVAARIGDRIQGRALQLEGAMKNLADSVVQLNQLGLESSNRYYTSSDFHQPGKAPPDLTASRQHQGKVSMQWPVWSVPKDAARADIEPAIRRLSGLQDYVREIYGRAATMAVSAQGNFYAEQTIDQTDDSSPIVAIIVGLENGVGMRYPGWDQLAPDYDPRSRPWYRLAAGKVEPQWGAPYLSSVSNLYELPLSVSLQDRDRKFLGVATALLLPEYLVQSLLDVDGTHGLRGLYLLAPNGLIMAQSGVAVRASSAPSDDNAAPVFPLQAVVDSVAKRRGGVISAPLLGSDCLVAFDVIEPLGWSVVAVAADEHIGGSPLTVH
ncbi:serine/threonine protein kinase [Tahibacter amnicola]|uniref:Serine/threonine protein kinase n=1 Tax=Tahibacter amnicola TaxID=2976241 RepID=A0ABY6BC87_9GAMM|nr:serine/threonine protein kinase [Tahibacter amnicola]UXI67455.1 serine/threonine protein kinase [Tahibacter amnicola]